MGYVFESLSELMKTHFLSLQIVNALMGVSGGVELPLLTILGRQLGHNEEDIANFLALLSVFRMVPGIPVGLLSECVDVRYLMMFTVVFHVFGCTLVFILMPKEISLWVFSVFYGISVGAFFLTRHLYVSFITKKMYRGMTFSFFAGALRWAHVCGPALLGAAASLWDDSRYYILVPLVTALIALTCMIADHVFFSSERQNECDNDNVEENGKKKSEPTEPLLGNLKKIEGGEGGDTPPHKGATVAVPSYDSTNFTHSNSEKNDVSDHLMAVKMPNSRNSETVKARRNSRASFNACWFVIVEQWSAIWRLGVYVILYVALRANRKLLLTFAAMDINFTNSQLAFLLSFSFLFDATLFPIGGFISDVYGRRWAMVPAVLGLGAAFMLLPLLRTPLWLYVMAGAFGAADALGCGLMLTLVADHAPKEFPGLFFGVMRTVQDTGHVVASLLVSAVILKVDFVVSCSMWGAVSVVAALWALFVVRVEV